MSQLCDMQMLPNQFVMFTSKAISLDELRWQRFSMSIPQYLSSMEYI